MKFDEQDKQDIIKAYNAGEGLAQVGKRYGVSGDTISYYVMQWGVPKRDNRKYKFTDDDYEFLKREYPLGNWNAILERFPGVPRHKIYRIMSDKKVAQDKYHWTEHDKNILIKYYGGLATQEIQHLLEKYYSIRLIQNQAKKLGLTETREWTDAEVRILYDNYERMTGEEIRALLPHRSVNAIYIKASSLNLQSGWKYEYLYTPEEDQIILDNWKMMSDKEMRALINRSPECIKARRHRLGLFREFGKNGYGTLVMYIRKNIAEWKKDSAEACHYQCVLTGDSFDEIHHIHGFRLIVNEAIENIQIDDRETINDYTEEELKLVLKEFKRVQSLYPLGVCLRKDVHQLYHHIYGYGNNTQDQWNEFTKDFNNGKYVDIIK